MKKLISIGVGGMIGTSYRYSISLLFVHHMQPFPYATLLANLLGCFLLTFLLHHEKVKRKLPPDIFIAFTVGVLGSLTTFSTVTIEMVELWQVNQWLAFTYLFISLFGGLSACLAGYKLAKKWEEHSQ